MQGTRLGSTDLTVSGLCHGTYTMSGAWGGDNRAGIETVRFCFDHGINFFDTAFAYGGGVAETALASGLGGLLADRRDELVLVTKGGLAMSELPEGGVSFGPDSSPEFLRSSLMNCLERLGTDYVDVYLIHWFDPQTPIEESAAAMRKFVDEGLVRYVGVSNYTVGQMKTFDSVTNLDVVQVPYNLFAQYTADYVLPYCSEHGIGVMGYSAVAQGYLTGHFDESTVFGDSDWRAHSPEFQGERFASRVRAAGELQELADRLGCTLPQLAIAWVRAHQVGVVPVIGTRSTANAISNLEALDVELTPADVELASAIGARAVQVDYADRVE